MEITSIICAKRDGRALSRDEIDFAVSSFVAGEVPDYQMSALLMAVCLRGMSISETVDLTRSMIASGGTLDLSALDGPKVDKHSTGGVGDKITLVAAPIAAAGGAVVAKLSGRGLAHTGGTLDKLEAIPGLRTDLTGPAIVRQAGKVGLVIAGQTSDIVPADKKIYALRDVTGTVASLPLITASIVSKKVAGGAEAVVFDVKAGSGAFARTEEEAMRLGRMLVEVSGMLDLRASAVISDMDQPLGRAVGNALEVREAVDVLRGDGPADVRELSVAIAARMLAMGRIARWEEAAGLAAQLLDDGSALDKFAETVEAQGGDRRVVDDPGSILPSTTQVANVLARRDGVVGRIDALAIGRAAGILGAGRTKAGEKVDSAAGVVLRRKVGDEVRAGDVLAELHSCGPERIAAADSLVDDAYEIGSRGRLRSPLILRPVEEC